MASSISAYLAVAVSLLATSASKLKIMELSQEARTKVLMNVTVECRNFGCSSAVIHLNLWKVQGNFQLLASVESCMKLSLHPLKRQFVDVKHALFFFVDGRRTVLLTSWKNRICLLPRPLKQRNAIWEWYITTRIAETMYWSIRISPCIPVDLGYSQQCLSSPN